MQYIKGTTEFHIEEDTVISLGKFDGIHRGHELLMDYLLQKKALGKKVVVFTFDIPPRKTVYGEEKVKVLTTNEEKMHLFEHMGVDYLIECPFVPEIMHMEPEDFIKMIVEQLHVKAIVSGKDFRFGHNRRGDYKLLEDYAPVFGYEVEVVEKVKEDGSDISSTRIRKEVENGNIEKANHLLGYRFFVQGEIVHGRQIGRTIQVPTINVIPSEEKLLPPFGVYVTENQIGAESYFGITNVGCKPTIEGDNPVGVETHLLEFSNDVYGAFVKTEFIKRVRPEMKFPSVEALREQLMQDIGYAKNYLTS